MDRKDAIAWTLSLCAPLRLSQAKTLSALVSAAMCAVRLTLGELGRWLGRQTGIAAKHGIKRVDRFLGNRRIVPTLAMEGAVRWLAQSGKKLLVSLDWVDVRSFHCLVLAARIRGRAIPLLWSVHWDSLLHRSRNNLEYGLLKALRAMVPATAQVVVLADRGFGRAEMARECQALGFSYIIRIVPNVFVRHREFTGNLQDWPVRVGQRRMLRNVAYRKNEPVVQHVAAIWEPEEEEPWFLMTNLPRLGAWKISKYFARRMSIEEYFRDAKSLRNGLALRLTLVRSPERFARLLLVVALAYLLLVMIGLHGSKRFRSGMWCSNNRAGECSLFTIGRNLLDHPLPSFRSLANALRREVLRGNWG
jgi:hypothetical protein